MEATNGGTLGSESTINNQNGTIVANGTGSQVLLNSNGTMQIQGGTLNTTGRRTMGSPQGVSSLRSMGAPMAR